MGSEMKAWLRISAVLLLILLTVSVASAHAKLIKASPAPNSVTGSPPAQLQMWFDEAVDINFSEVQVLDSKKQQVNTGELVPAPGDANSILVPLKPIGDGTYNVIWKVLSATDGHITRGVYAFGVGDTASIVAAPIDSGASSGSSELSPLGAVVRWASLFSLLALVGGFIFRFFLVDRSFDYVESTTERRPLKQARQVAYKRWLQLTTAAFIIFFVSNFAELLLQVSLVTDQVSFTSIFTILFNSRSGMLLLMRVGLIAACAVLVALEARRIRVPFNDYALIVLGNVALITRPLLSHSAASGNFSLPVFADWLHLLGVALWVGGLFYLAWLMPFIWRALDPKLRGVWIAWLVPQFSIMAIAATIVIGITGVYNSTQQVPALDIVTTRALPTITQLTEGTYSDALLMKVALFVVMLGFGALNLLLLSPRFRSYIAEPEKSAHLFSRFRITVGAEVVLGLTVIFLAGILTLTPPPRSEAAPENAPIVQEQPERPVLLVDYPSKDVQVQLEIGPKPGSPTLFNAKVTDRNGNALPDLQRVIFNFMYLNEDTGAQNVTAESRGENQYAVEGNYLSLEGMWKIKVTVRQKGIEDQAVEFPYFIAPASADTNSVMTAQLALKQAQQQMNALKTLRSTQNLNDGSNGVVASNFAYQAPDKTNFSIEGQGEAIAIGADQYYQNKDGTWTQRGRVENFVFPDFTFADAAQTVRAGRADTLDGKGAQIILFDTPTTSGNELIHYAYWIDEADKYVKQLAMVTAGHYMMQYYRDFNSPNISIIPPTNLAPAATPAPVVGGETPLTTAVQGSPRPSGFITGDMEGDGALVMVVVGVVALLVGSGGKRTRSTRMVVLGVGAASVLLGIGLFVDAVNGTTAAALNVPVNTTRASSGQLIYEQNCLACHGEKGHGDGPGAKALPVQPFDLTTHVLLHDEQYLYATILNGRGYMPAFGSRLSQDQILDVIAYARLLARNAQQQGAPNATPRPGFTPQP